MANLILLSEAITPLSSDIPLITGNCINSESKQQVAVNNKVQKPHLVSELSPHISSRGKGDQGTEQNGGQPAAKNTLLCQCGRDLKLKHTFLDPEERMDIIA